MRLLVRKKGYFSSPLDFAQLPIYHLYRDLYEQITDVRTKSGDDEGVGTQKRYGSHSIIIERRVEQ